MGGSPMALLSQLHHHHPIATQMCPRSFRFRQPQFRKMLTVSLKYTAPSA